MTHLTKTLTIQQQQAYAGAKTFYNCFLPFTMFMLLAAHLLLLRIASTQFSYVPLSATLISILFYFSARKYYQICNQIDTSPILHPPALIETNNKLQSGDLQESNLVLDKPMPIKCQKCEIVCDYRTKHCRKCQVCVQRFDHHCFWIGNCVGRHNHRPFLVFLLLQTCNNALNFYSLYQLHPLFNEASLSIPTICYLCYLAMLLLACGFVLFTGYLLLYHSMLVSCGMTTWQHMRRSKISYLKYLPVGYNPFSEGVIQNIHIFFSQSTRYTGEPTAVNWGEFLPTFEESRQIKPGCNLIENEYYSCC